MSEQSGIIKLTGSMGNITFYNAYGKSLARKKAGPDRKTIMHNPRYDRTRRNIREFGGCSRIASALRHALHEVKPLTDGQFGNRMISRSF
jgi:hypothetical protein